jgi:hypothetical protein
MTARTHRTLFILGTVAWVAFWIAGLPSYYQQYSTTFMIWFDALLLVPLTIVFARMLRRVRANRRLTVSLWMSFYFTVPLAVYDWLYCGLFLDRGVAFVFRYWYLSVYYVIPWLVLPACAAWLNRTPRASAASESVATPPRNR